MSLPSLQQPRTVAVSLQPGLRQRVEKLNARIAALKTAPGTPLWTAQYPAELFRRADRSEIAVANFDLPKEIERGEALVSALEVGANPLAKKTGDLRLAYNSKVDSSLQPYRLFLPSAYDGAEPFPLIVALHGMGGDENTLFDRYSDESIEKLAEKNGYIVAAPKGREPASMYRESAEQDVLDVLSQVRSDHKIDPNRIYMMGHSMGAFGTWSTAMDHPEIFAALGPISGGGDPRGMEKIRSIPQIVVHGDNDKTVNVRMSRTMVEAARKLGTEIEYVEVPGGGHNEIVVPALPRVFEFFNKHSKKAAAAGAN